MGPLTYIRTQHSLGCIRISQFDNMIVGLNMVHLKKKFANWGHQIILEHDGLLGCIFPPKKAIGLC
jgi:hypothetical protein